MRFYSSLDVLVIAIVAIVGTARADSYVVPRTFMDAYEIANVTSTLEQFASVGTYTGKTSAGKSCGVIVSGNNGQGSALDLSGTDGGEITIYPASAEFRSYLLNLSNTESEGRLLVVVYTVQTETIGNFVSLVTITGKNGMPSSIQFGSAYPPGGSGFSPGAVIASSDVLQSPVCDHLAKTP